MTAQEFYLLYDACLPRDPRRTLDDEDYEALGAMLDD